MSKKKDANNLISKKRMPGWLRFFLGVAIILGAGYVVLNYVPAIAKYDHFVIVTGSMEPVIHVGDVVIVDTSVNPDDLVPGQIIAFHADINEDGVADEVVVHYLSSVTEVDGVMIYKTHPEVSDANDPWDLTSEDIVGAYVLTIPKIGPFLLFAQSTFGKITLVADIFILYVIGELISDTKKRHQKKVEEQNPETKNDEV